MKRAYVRGFCLRVRALIDRFDDGNVTAAARRIHVRQRTLAKIYSGLTKNPRLGVIQQLVRGYPPEYGLWLLMGDAELERVYASNDKPRHMESFVFVAEIPASRRRPNKNPAR